MGLSLRKRDSVKRLPFKCPGILDLSSAAAERQIINPGPGKVINANNRGLRCKIVPLGRRSRYLSRQIAFLPTETKQVVCYGYDLVIVSPDCEDVSCTENDCVVICKHGRSIWCYKKSLAICTVECENVFLENNKIQVSVEESFDFHSFISNNFGLR
ncbi:unnamed protein product [Mytilus coruscus]|uniref:Uncharacterized protein n=1 Tax=Mytilus coruscus TaxID=42192 RepID=A0A6J8F118_MYTCO|nr:unnamed protein product [Mytilus coruscus]